MSFQTCMICFSKKHKEEKCWGMRIVNLAKFKGIVPQKWKFCHHLLILKLFWICSLFLLLSTKKIIWRILVTKQLTVAIEFDSMEKKYYVKVNGYHLVTTVLQNNLFCVQQKKETHTGLNKWRVNKWWQNFHFWVSYPFKSLFTNNLPSEIIIQRTGSLIQWVKWSDSWTKHSVFKFSDSLNGLSVFFWFWNDFRLFTTQIYCMVLSRLFEI